MAATQDLAIDPARVNVNGGACALGHPIGATGARHHHALIHALRARGLRRGIASQCIGGGEATAIAIESDPLSGRQGRQRRPRRICRPA